MAELSVTHGLKFQARALAAQVAETSCSRWLVGTLALREENEVQVMEFDPDAECIKCVAALVHPAEVWSLSPSLWSPNRFISIYNKGGTYGTSLWEYKDGETELTEVAKLSGHEGVIRSALWHPADKGCALTLEEGRLRLWSLAEGGATCSSEKRPEALETLWGAAWGPADPNCLATCGGTGLQLWDPRDLRKGKQLSVDNAHRMPIRDLDFSRQSSFYLVSAGDDCKLRVWDTRRLGRGAIEPVKELGGRHSHWVWQGRVNPFHEELILSSSSDCQVVLWHVPSFEAFSEGVGSPGTSVRQPASRYPAVVTSQAYDEHDDSVYGAAWSAADPWVFASLSYDGNLVVNGVPNSTKYKILL